MDSLLAIVVPLAIVGTLLGRRCLQLQAQLDTQTAELEARIVSLEALVDTAHLPTFFTEENS